MRGILSFVAIFALLMFVGCSSKPPKTAPKKEATEVSQPEVGKVQEQAAGEVTAPTEVPAGKAEGYEAERSSECELREFPNIHFAFDRYDLNDEAKQILRQIADYMKKCPNIVLTIEGHCDERGSNEYNLALGWKRANEAKKFLVALGVDPDRIITVSYGEERPLCFEHNEACWAKNRRDHFVFCKGECLR